jgi:trk system potassium uptake protein TrkA
MKPRFIVIGLGSFGTALALKLAAKGSDVLAVDLRMAAVEEVKDKVSLAVQLDASEPAALQSVEAETCTAAIVTMGEAFENAVLCVAALKEVKARRIIARARTPRRARILSAIGADEVLELEAEAGRRLGERLVQ